RGGGGRTARRHSVGRHARLDRRFPQERRLGRPLDLEERRLPPAPSPGGRGQGGGRPFCARRHQRRRRRLAFRLRPRHPPRPPPEGLLRIPLQGFPPPPPRENERPPPVGPPPRR